MARKTNWSRRFAHPITPLDGERMIELQDVVTYMLAIGDRNNFRYSPELGTSPLRRGLL